MVTNQNEKGIVKKRGESVRGEFGGSEVRERERERERERVLTIESVNELGVIVIAIMSRRLILFYGAFGV